MAKDDAESISIEEANKIRASLGLKPLRVDKVEEPKRVEKAVEKEDAESLSIAETNKVRLALGLKPIKTDAESSTAAVDDSSFEGQEKRAFENFQKHKAEQEKKDAREARIAKIKKEAEVAQRNAKLDGRGIADEEEDDDAAAWLKKQKKRQKKLEQAEKTAKELASREEEALRGAQYGEKDLEGMRVGHDLDEFQDVEGAILTLKDAEILDNEGDGDELISTELAEQERLQERLQLKKRKPEYNPYDDEEEGGERRILAKYDEEIDGKKKKQFLLGNNTRVSTSDASTSTKQQQISEKLKRLPVNFDTEEAVPEASSDYLDPSSIKIKKSKRKKERNTKRRVEDDEETGDRSTAGMDLDSVPENKPKRPLKDVSFVDDDELSNALAQQRRAALKNRKFVKPEDLARKLREESEEKDIKEEDDNEPGMIIDDTSEFVNSLRAPTIPERRQAHVKIEQSYQEQPLPDAGYDVDMNDALGEDVHVVKKEEDEDEDQRILSKPSVLEISSTGLAQEATIGIGTAGMLKMLKERQLLSQGEDDEAHDKLRKREKFLAEKRAREVEFEKKARMQREKDRQSGKFERMSAREREDYARWENKTREQQEARAQAERFKDYKPDVKLEYKDEHGRSMNPKEAFKYLSHQFHGKGSGKQKTEKKLKKIEDEKKREAASSLNTEGMVSSMATAAKKSKTAGVRLM